MRGTRKLAAMSEDETFMLHERDELRRIRDLLSNQLPSDRASVLAVQALATIVDDLLVHLVYKLARHRLTGEETLS